MQQFLPVIQLVNYVFKIYQIVHKQCNTNTCNAAARKCHAEQAQGNTGLLRKTTKQLGTNFLTHSCHMAYTENQASIVMTPHEFYRTFWPQTTVQTFMEIE